MKSWAILIVMLLVMGGLAAMAHGSSVRAGETITTDKSVYVVGEIMNVVVHGENTTDYDILIDGHWIDTIQTNATGYYSGNYSVDSYNNLNPGVHKIQLELSYSSGVIASTQVVVRKGLTLWNSEYTHTNVYLSGEKMWVKLEGENNKTYFLNVTNMTGHVAYPSNGGYISVTTNNTGIAVFNITLNIGDDDYVLNLYNGSKFIQDRYFEVRSVSVSVSLDKGSYGVYLMSEKLHVYVSVYWMKTHTLLSGAHYKWWIVDASNSSMSFGPYPADKPEFTTEQLTFYTMGNNPNIHIMPNREYLLKVEYDNTNNTGRHYDVSYVHFYTGHLWASVGVNAIDGSLSPGKRAMITLNTFARYGTSMTTSALGNVKVDYINITITKHWQILWTQNYTNYGYTDIGGSLHMIWNIPNVETGSEISIKAGVSINNEHYIASDEEWIYPYVKLSISTDKDFYLAGETMNVNLKSYSPAGVELLGYDVWIYNSDHLFYYTTTTNNNVQYTIPTNYSGSLSIKVLAHFSNGDEMGASKNVGVYYGYIYLSASQDYYFKAGDQIVIYSEFRSQVMHPTTLLYKIMDDKGNIVMEMNASLNQFTFTVPNAQSTYYTIMVEAIDGNYYASNTLTISKFEGYFLSTHIVTKSKYQSMVYEPGQTIKIAYSITKYGDFDPHVIVLHWGIFNTNYHWEKVITENEFNGEISLTIPKDLKGGYVIDVWVTDSENTDSTWNLMTIDVEQGSWSMQDVAGMPMLSFINLILVIVAIVIGVLALLMLRKRGEPAAIIPAKTTKKKGAPKPYSPEGEEETKEQPEANASEEEEEELGKI